jgi:hypothetical protein
MRTLLPLVRRGQPEATARWFRGAVYHHALRTGKPQPLRQAAEAGLWAAGAIALGVAGLTWAALAALGAGLWRLQRGQGRRTQAEALRIALSPPVRDARIRVEVVHG